MYRGNVALTRYCLQSPACRAIVASNGSCIFNSVACRTQAELYIKVVHVGIATCWCVSGYGREAREGSWPRACEVRCRVWPQWRLAWSLARTVRGEVLP